MQVKYLGGNGKIKKVNKLISIDIGYSTCGICIYDFKKEEWFTFSPKLKQFLKGYNTKNIGIPEYLLLSQKVTDFVIQELCNYTDFKESISISLEVPAIMMSFAVGLSMLLQTLVRNFLKYECVHNIFLTNNRLGGYYLKRRSFTKSDIKDMLNIIVADDKKLPNEHTRDSFMACYTILVLAYRINLYPAMRSLEGSTIVPLQLEGLT